MPSLRIAMAAIEIETRTGFPAIDPDTAAKVMDPLRHASVCFEMMAIVCATGYQLFGRDQALPTVD
jgi:hypothetical protein